MKTRTTLLALALVGAGSLAGFGLKTVLADGIPTVNPLYYSGTLTENGQLVDNTTRTITINLWLDPVATLGDNALCVTAVDTPVINGRFRIALNGSCKAVINANPDVYVEVMDGNTSLGRSKIGAVPYAVEADHAVSATNAADGGGISSALSVLAPRSSVPIITAWQAYTPTLATSDGSPITNTSVTGMYRRVGDTMDIQIAVAFGGAVSSSSSNTWYLTVPTGQQIDGSKLVSSLYTSVGGGYAYTTTGSNPNIFALQPEVVGSNVLQIGVSGADCNLAIGCPSSGWATSGSVFVTASVPIVGWSVTP